MKNTRTTLAGAGQARQQEAEIKADDLNPQDNPSLTADQSEVPPDNSASSQRQKIIVWLYKVPLMTLQARNIRRICPTAARIMELKAQGHRIETLRVEELDATGRAHRVVRYVLNLG